MIYCSIPDGTDTQKGNVLLYILIGIVLVGLLTAAINQTSNTSQDMDKERLVLTATEIQRYAAQIQSGISIIRQNGISEADLRFSHPKADSNYGLITANETSQVFGSKGGRADYKLPPAPISASPIQWEFTGETALENVGTDAPELLAVLPGVTTEFCDVINRQLGLTSQTPSSCGLQSSPTRFTGSFAASPSTMSDDAFDKTPVMQGCVKCTSPTKNFYFYTLLTR